MADLETFNFDGADVRVVVRGGAPWWVHNDVCACLGIADAPQAAERLDDDEKGWVDLPTPRGTQRIRVVNEPGLYSLVLRSKTSEAKRFKRWVTHEVLPAIRKTGAYSATPPQVPSPAFALPQTYSEALRALADEHDAREAAEAREAAALKRLSVAEPRAVAWSVLADPARDYDVGSAAAILNRDPAINTGRNRLFKWMLANGLIYEDREHGRRRKVYKPYQKHVDAGRIVLRIGSPWTNPKTGDTEVGSPVLMITVKGLGYIHQKMGGTATLDLSDRSEPLALPPAVQ